MMAVYCLFLSMVIGGGESQLIGFTSGAFSAVGDGDDGAGDGSGADPPQDTSANTSGIDIMPIMRDNILVFIYSAP
jgi:hypothetical protein